MTMTIVETASVETLGLNYVSFGIYVVVNNLWTLVAVATAAAASFWRFKLAPPLPENRHCNVHVSSPEISDDSSPVVSIHKVNLNTTIPPPLTADCSDDGAVAGERVFTRFCFDDVTDEEQDLMDDERSALVLVAQVQDYQLENKTVRFNVSDRLRLLDLGVYEHLDMRVLDGNVVKLWDSCRVRSSPKATLRSPIGSSDLLEELLRRL